MTLLRKINDESEYESYKISAHTHFKLPIKCVQFSVLDLRV